MDSINLSRLFVVFIFIVGRCAKGEDICNPDEFHCNDGGQTPCIPTYWLCDNEKNCLHGADENPDNCDITECHREDFVCPSNGKCIPPAWLCDGDEDCEDGKDEQANCTEPEKCGEKQIQCPTNGKCITVKFACDGRTDCPDGYDERHHCDCSAANLFPCEDEELCLPFSKVCDNKFDCKDDSDEGHICGNSCSLTCGHGSCRKTPRGPICLCDKGFKEDGGTCVDIDECSEFEECDHFCKNTVGNFTCSCAVGYSLQGKSLCKADGSPAMLFFAYNNAVNRVTLGPIPHFEEIFKGHPRVISIAYDPIDQQVYWSDASKKVYRKSISKSANPEEFISKDLGIVYTLAMDWLGRNLYLSDEENSRIVVCSVKSKACKSLLGHTRARAIQLDLSKGLLYFSDTNKTEINLADMDGTNYRSLFVDNVTWPNAMAIDMPVRVLYWMDAKHDVLERLDLDKQTRKIIPGIVLAHPYSMAVWEDKIYWSDWHTKNLAVAYKQDGRNQTDFFRGGDFSVFQILIYHEQMLIESRSGENPCESADCSHICLLASKRPYYACACPSELKLTPDRKTCLATGASSLVLSTNTELYHVEQREFSSPRINSLVRDGHTFKRITDLDYNPKDEFLFVCDQGDQAIKRVDLGTGKVTTVVHNIQKPSGIAVDWARGNLYLVDTHRKALEVATVDGNFRKYLNMKKSCSALDVAVSSTKGVLVLACEQPGAKILRCTRNADHCIELASKNVRSPLCLTIDQRSKEEYVYWTDSSRNKLERVSLDGTERKATSRLNSAGILMTRGLLYHTVIGNYKTLYYADGLSDAVKFSEITLNLPGSSYDRGHMSVAEVGWHVEPEMEQPDQFCIRHDGLCQQLCLENKMGERECACEDGQMLSSDGFSCQPLQCGGDHHKCEQEGKCISNKLRCNGVWDCRDGSDEYSNLCSKCSDVQFACSSKECVASDQRCDGFPDCFDHSDEFGCATLHCKYQSYTPCIDTSGCVPNTSFCDGKQDCADGTDEANCSCAEDEFTCSVGNGCIPNHWVCDDNEDCVDKSDEQNCKKDCTADEFSCNDGHLCIPRNKTCDGVSDCQSSEDEMLNSCKADAECSTNDQSCKKSCKSNEFSCMSGERCIHQSLQCDGYTQCKDSSDENSCPEIFKPNASKSLYCPLGEFSCGSDTCVPFSKVCDGVPDCENNADEDPTCDQHCLNGGGCEHHCNPHPVERICYCRSGYRLHDNGYSCDDVDECAGVNECEQYCTNTVGGFYCRCDDGYDMEDKFSCKPTNGSLSGYALLSDRTLSWMGQAPAAPGTIAISPKLTISRIIYHNAKKTLFALDNAGELGVITTSDLRYTPLITGLKRPKALSLDAPANNVYISQHMEGLHLTVANILVCSLKTMVCKTIYEENAEIPSVAVAKKQRLLVFCVNKPESLRTEIFVANLDGNQRQTLFSGQGRCEHLTLDEPKKTVYWFDSELLRLNSIVWSTLEMSLYKDLQYDIKNLEMHGFWLQWQLSNGTLQRCRKYKSDVCRPLPLKDPSVVLTTVTNFEEPASRVCSSQTECKNLCITLSNSAVCLCEDPTQPGCSVPKALSSKRCDYSLCSPGGECLAGEEHSFYCKCHDGYEGERCSVKKVHLEPEDGFVAPLIVVLVLLVLVAAGVGLYYYYKRPLFLFKRNKNTDTSIRFTNPAFGASKDEIDATLSGSGTPQRKASVVHEHSSGPMVSVHLNADLHFSEDSRMQCSGAEFTTTAVKV